MNSWQKTFDRSKYKCVYCEFPLWDDFRIWHNSTEDHLYPDSKSGASSASNLVAACQVCNSLKDDFVPQPFASQPGVLFVKPNKKVEVVAAHRPEYIRLVADELLQRRIAREGAFHAEKKRIGKA